MPSEIDSAKVFHEGVEGVWYKTDTARELTKKSVLYDFKVRQLDLMTQKFNAKDTQATKCERQIEELLRAGKSYGDSVQKLGAATAELQEENVTLRNRARRRGLWLAGSLGLTLAAATTLIAVAHP